MSIYVIACYTDNDWLHEPVWDATDKFDACKKQPTFWALIEELAADEGGELPTDIDELQELLDPYSIPLSILKLD